MSKHTELLQEVWSEKALCDHLGLECKGPENRSEALSLWINLGLRFVDMGFGRYFLQQDVIDYLLRYRKRMGEITET